MLAHFALSDHSQTYFFYPNVHSLAYIIQQNADNFSDICNKTKESLVKYYETQFSDVVCEVREMTERKTDELDTKLAIFLEFTDSEGKRHNLAKIIPYEGTVVKGVFNYSNYGPGAQENV